jgi:hypothetical protein
VNATARSSGFAESRTWMHKCLEETSTQFPPFMLRLDLRQPVQHWSGPVVDDIRPPCLTLSRKCHPSTHNGTSKKRPDVMWLKRLMA